MTRSRAIQRYVVGALAVLAAGAVPGPGPAHAQEAADTAAPVRLDTLTVRVLRAPAALRDAPFAVTVNAGPWVRRGRPTLALDESLRGVPGVQVDNRHNYALGERVSIRGSGARAQFGVRGVKVLVDGIPATLPDGQTALSHVDAGAIERAEVIRGPASALYGNAAGGVIRLETPDPPSSPWQHEIRAVGGQNGLLRLRGVTGGRRGPASYRIDVSTLSYDGYREHGAADKLHGTARVDYDAAAGDLTAVGHFVSYDAQNPGSLSDAQLAEDRMQAHGFNVVQKTGERARQAQIGATWRSTLDHGELEIAAYGLHRELDNPIPPAIIDLSRRVGGARAVVRSPTGGDASGLHWTVGVEGDLQSDDRRNFANDGGDRGALQLDQTERVRSIGSFAQVVGRVADRLRVQAGLRYDRFRFSVSDRFVRASSPDGPGDPDDSGDRAMDAWSPSLGVTYTLAPAANIYANVGTAFETPTTTELVNRPDGAGGFNPTLDPQRTRSVEVGLKGRIAPAARYEVTAYRAVVRDALIPYQVPDVPDRNFFRNAGSALHRGIEAAAAVAPTDALGLRLSGTYTDARFRDYTVEDESFADRRVPGVAPWRIEAGLSYEAPAGAFLDLETRYVSRVPGDDANTAFSPAYYLTDLRTGVRGLRLGDIEVEPFAGVTNLFDEAYNAAVTVNAFGGRYYEPGPGRAVYVGTGLRFGAD